MVKNLEQDALTINNSVYLFINLMLFPLDIVVYHQCTSDTVDKSRINVYKYCEQLQDHILSTLINLVLPK